MPEPQTSCLVGGHTNHSATVTWRSVPNFQQDDFFFTGEDNIQVPSTIHSGMVKFLHKTSRYWWSLPLVAIFLHIQHPPKLLVIPVQTFAYNSVLLTGLEFNYTVKDFLSPWLWVLIDINVIRNCAQKFVLLVRSTDEKSEQSIFGSNFQGWQ